MTFKIEVTDYKENENGTASVEFEASEEAKKMVLDVGMQVFLLCGAFGVSTEDMINKMIEVYEDD